MSAHLRRHCLRYNRHQSLGSLKTFAKYKDKPPKRTNAQFGASTRNRRPTSSQGGASWEASGKKSTCRFDVVPLSRDTSERKD